jgi:demethylmenaquinone methyltransferase / 2-methoxy-6-polyprenyl-1,4-benzoquinol methylase
MVVPGRSRTILAAMPASTPPHRVLARYYRSEHDRASFVTTLFDGAARHYDWVGHLLAFGSGPYYRRRALAHAGLRPGMTLLDVATGTGQVARAAASILGDPRRVIGLDPSAGMLREARKVHSSPLVRGRAEEIPLRDDTFDMLSMGFALRHVDTLETAFAEYRRVLKPGGRLLLLEVSRPRSPMIRWPIRVYFQQVLPLIIRIATGSADARLLMKYYWDTIDECVPPALILAALEQTGFAEVQHRLLGGCLSEYVAVKARASGPPR